MCIIRGLIFLLATACAAPGVALAQATAPPHPAAVLGHGVGESGHLADWAAIVAYFETLDATSPLLTLERIGGTVQGRPMVMAVITSAANQSRLVDLRAGQARLADPRGVDPREIEHLLATQPAVALIGASLHGNEIMATQMSMELAHDLVTDPALVRALDDVVVLLVPGLNPDGLDITREWWLRTRGTPHAGTTMPWLYHHYAGHDSNRDFFMVTQPETRAVTRILYEEWFPQVVYDVHQMGNTGARFFIPPFADPLNPNIDPLIVRMTNLVGVQMALALTEAGKTGVSHGTTFDLWWHGGARTVPARHNMIGILSEAASADYGDAIEQDPARLNQPETGSLYPEPWPGGIWSPRDIVEYELIASKALVRLLHRQRDDFVRNFVELAWRQVRAGADGAPFAFVLPAVQRDPGSAAELMRVLRRGGVEIHRATTPFVAGGRRFPAGSHVVRMAQPYRSHAKDLLEPQRYPERRLYPGGPPAPPYDLAGWTLPMQMGVEVVKIPTFFGITRQERVDEVTVAVGRAGGMDGSTAGVALNPSMNAAHRAIHETLSAGGSVTFTDWPVRVEMDGPEIWPPGTAIVSGVADLDARRRRWATAWGLDSWSVPAATTGREMTRLRVGLYQPRFGSIDEGWTRWVFEEWDVPFSTVGDERIRAGWLSDDFDAIVVPSIPYGQFMNGPPRAHPDFAGGIGRKGAEALREFVEGGGTLVLLDAATEFATSQLGVRARNIEAGQTGPEADRWYAPGSLVRVQWDREHPVATGMPADGAVFYSRSPVFEVEPGADNVRVVARYPAAGEILMSGYAQREDRIAGRAALLEAIVGEGRVVMFGFRPQHRAQPHLTFKPLFNALYPAP